MRWTDSRSRAGHHRATEAEAATCGADECEGLDDEVKKRANEMCMMMQLQSLARRTKLR